MRKPSFLRTFINSVHQRGNQHIRPGSVVDNAVGQVVGAIILPIAFIVTRQKRRDLKRSKNVV